MRAFCRTAVVALALLAAPRPATPRGPPAEDPPSIHHRGYADQADDRPAKRDLLDGLLPGTWLRPSVVRPGPAQPAPQPIVPADLEPFPHDTASPASPDPSLRETVRIPLPRARDGLSHLEVHHLLGTVTYEPGPDGAFEVTLVRGGNTIRLGVREADRTTIVETLAWGFPDFDRAISYVRRGEKPADAHLFIKAPASTYAKLCTWGGTISVNGAVGRVEAIAGSGQVDVEGFKGRLDVTTDAGPVFLGGGIDASVLVRTISGHVYAQGFAGDLDARTNSGAITAEYRTLGTGDQHLWTLSGSVDVTLPRTSEVRVDVHAPWENILSSLPLSSVSQATRRYTGVQNFARNYLDVHSDSGRVNLSNN